jgi:multicomponent Na+:H+ antiporter subunit D
MTDTIVSIRPLLAVLVSALGAFLISFSGKRPNLRETWTVAAGVVKFLLVASMIPWVMAGKRVVFTVSSFWPGLDIRFSVDALGLLFGLTASFLWILTSFYSIGYMRSLKEHAQTRYFTCFSIALSATIGLAFSANLLTLFIFYELITFSTYPLVAHKETPEAFAGGNKYLAYLVGSSKAFFLVAVLLTWTLAGTLDFRPGGIMGGVQAKGLVILAFFLFLFGVAKSAIMPIHSWLPSAMVAPTPVSALLHAVAVVKAGVFTIVRVMLFIYGPATMKDLHLDVWAITLASITIITASLIALGRDNLKARLAYSTVSQLSYIILGAALVSPLANQGAVMHITVHAFSKITLFFCAGAIYVAAHKTEISQLSGIGRRMPWTMGAFSVGALSLIGVPPLAGFISKWYLALGSLQAVSPAVLFVIMTSTMLNAAYFLPIIYKAFFEKPPEGEGEQVHEAPLFILVPLVLTAAMTIILGCWPSLLIDMARRVIG